MSRAFRRPPRLLINSKMLLSHLAAYPMPRRDLEERANFKK